LATKIFSWPISEEGQQGDSVAYLHEVTFFIDRHAWPLPRNQKQQCRNISCKHLRYTFDKAAEKMYGRGLFPSPHVTAGDFLGIESFFFETLQERSSRCTGQAGRPIKKNTLCKKVTELPGWTSSLIGQKNIFLVNRRDGFLPLPKKSLARKYLNLPASSPWSPRMIHALPGIAAFK